MELGIDLNSATKYSSVFLNLLIFIEKVEPVKGYGK